MSTHLTCTQIGTLSLAMVKHASLEELIGKIKGGWEGMGEENQRTAIGGAAGAAGGGLLGMILSGRLGPTVTSALLGGGAGAASGRYLPQILEMLGMGGGGENELASDQMRLNEMQARADQNMKELYPQKSDPFETEGRLPKGKIDAGNPGTIKARGGEMYPQEGISSGRLSLPEDAPLPAMNWYEDPNMRNMA